MMDYSQGHHGFDDLSRQREIPVIDDWLYAMRRDMQEILPGLFLGPYGAAGKSKLAVLQKYQITHIVCVRSTDEEKIVKVNFANQFQSLVVRLAESKTETLIPKVKDFHSFVDNCLNNGGRVLVYCMDGMSRGPSLVIAYLMLKYGLKFQESLRYVQNRRFCVQPSPLLEVQLKEFEPVSQAESLRVQNSAVIQRSKRSHDEDEEEEEVVAVSKRHLMTTVVRCLEMSAAAAAAPPSEDNQMDEG